MRRCIVLLVVLSFWGLGLAPGTPPAQAAALRRGDKVVTVASAPLQVEEKTLTTVRRWAMLEVIDTKDDWVAVSVEDLGKPLQGWIRREHLVAVPAKLLEKAADGPRAAGVLGTPDAVAVAAVLAHPDAEIRRQAAARLEGMGPRAAPALSALAEAMGDADQSVRAAAAAALGGLGQTAEAAVPRLIAALRDSNPSVRVEALQALTRVGPPAVPALLEALAEEETRAEAAEALARIGPPAIAGLLKLAATAPGALRPLAEETVIRVKAAGVKPLADALADPSPQVRCKAAFLLGEAGPDAARVLTDALADKHPEVRMLVADALGRIGPRARTAVPKLLAALEDPDERVRIVAVKALGAVGAGYGQVIPALITRLNDKTLRAASADALARLGPSAAPLLQQAVRQSTEASVRQAAVYALGGACREEAAGEETAQKARPARAEGPPRPEVAAAVATLVPLLNSPDATLRLLAADALGRIGRPAVTPLGTVLADASFSQRWLAALALAQMGPKAAPAVQALAAALNDDQQELCSAAALALGRIGPDAKEAVGPLGRALEKRLTGEARLNAGLALWQIEKHAWGPQILAQTLGDESAHVRLASAAAVKQIGAGAGEAVPALVKALKEDSNESVRAAAAAALAEIGPAAKAAVPELAKAAETVRDQVRANVGWALWTTEKHPWAAQLLAQTLDCPASRVRAASASALAEIGSAASEAVPKLAAALQDGDREVRTLAAMALARIDSPASSPAVPALRAALGKAVGQERLAMSWALWKTTKETAVVAELIDLLADPDVEVRSGAMGVLADVGPAAKAAAPALRLLLLSLDPSTRASAAAVLGRIGKDAHGATALLVNRLDDPDKTVRYQAGAALQQIEENPGASVKRICRAYDEASKETKTNVARAYIGLDPEHLPEIKVKQLVQALKQGEQEDRRKAALLLAAWDKSAESAAEDIRDARQAEKDNDVLWCITLASEAKGPKVDERVRRALNERKVKYTVNNNGNFQAIFDTEAKRTQAAVIVSHTEKLRHLEIRQVWSVGYEAEGEFPAEIARRLLRDNSKWKWGAWEISGKLAVFVAKVAADADGEAVWTALIHVTSIADELEKELARGDKH